MLERDVWEYRSLQPSRVSIYPRSQLRLLKMKKCSPTNDPVARESMAHIYSKLINAFE